MVEINNQRSAPSICWRGRRELITDVRKPEIMVIRRQAGDEVYRLPDHSCKLVTLNPKLKSTGAGRYQLLFPLVGCSPQAAWPERLLSEKSGRCGIAAD